MSVRDKHKTVFNKRDISSYPARQRILAAALKLFVKQGYFNTNIPDLCKESQCSVGSIYHNFKNKEDIAFALYLEGIKAFRNVLGQSIHKDLSAEVAIKNLVIAFMEFSEANLNLSKYLWLCRHNEFIGEGVKHPTRVGFDNLGRSLTVIIKRGIENKEIKNLKANLIWSIIFGMPLAYIRDWLEGYNSDAPGVVSEQIAQICWQALKE